MSLNDDPFRRPDGDLERGSATASPSLERPCRPQRRHAPGPPPTPTTCARDPRPCWARPLPVPSRGRRRRRKPQMITIPDAPYDRSMWGGRRGRRKGVGAPGTGMRPLRAGGARGGGKAPPRAIPYPPPQLHAEFPLATIQSPRPGSGVPPRPDGPAIPDPPSAHRTGWWLAPRR